MDEQQAKRLGTFLRKGREALGLSARQLAERCELPHTTITRIEEGAFAAPSPDKLSRMAEVLGVQLADVYALAEYAIPADLPSPTLYLRTKLRGMPARELADVSREVEAVLKRHGVKLDEASTASAGNTATARAKPKSRRKGGKQ